jgi:prefoldin subunit 1
MSGLSDQTIQRIFAELQNALIDSSRQLSTVQAQIQAKQRERRLAELTKKELDPLDPDTKTYKAVGKMFIQSPLQQQKKEFDGKVRSITAELNDLGKKEKYLANKANDAQGNLKDLMGGPRHM